MAALMRGSVGVRLLVAMVVSAWALAAPAVAAGPATTLTLQLSPPTITANGAMSTTATATVKDAGGQPVPGDTVTITSNDSGDTVSIVTDNSDGTYTATITSTHAVASTITATNTSVTGVSDQKTLGKTPGPAAQISVGVTPGSITANGTAASTATATVKDAHNNPVPGETVTIGSNDGADTVSAVTDHGDGTYTATIKSTHAGTSTITASDTGVPSDTTSLTKTPGPAAHVAVQLGSNPIVADGSSTSVVTATVTDANGNPRSADTVTFSPAGRFGSVTPLGSGQYRATYTSTTTAGPVTITATDGAASGQATITQAPGPPAHVTLQAAPTSIGATGSSTSTVTATVTDLNGNRVPSAAVSFAPASQFGPVTPHADGTYTATYTSTTAVGPVTITATAGSASGQTTLNQTPFSVTTLSPTPSASVTNQVVTLIAIVTASGGSQAPQGTMTFQDNGVAISGCVNLPVVADQQLISQSTCQSALGASTVPRRLTAVFTSSSAGLAGSSGTTSMTVRQSTTSTSLGVSNPTPSAGSSASYTATIAPSHTGPITPGGTVTFLDGGQAIPGCTAQRVSLAFGQSMATCTVNYSQPGGHSIAARYNGDTNFAGSATSAQTVTVRKRPVTVLGTIKASMQWTFFFTPGYTAVRQFVVGGAPIGAAVSLSCRGKGCPRASIVRTVKACKPKSGQKCHGSRAGAVDLLGVLRHRRLKPGTQIVVKITRPNWIGKYYRFTIRSARGPAVAIDCLAPGGKNPGVGC